MIREIHRRSLWQVLGIYLGGSWGALQVVDVLTGNFALPDWFPALALGFLVLGLPVVLATAIVQVGVGGRADGEGADGRRVAQGADDRTAAFGAAAERGATGAAEASGRSTPSGVTSAPGGGASLAQAAHHRLLTWRNALLGGVGAFALWGVIAAGWLVLGGSVPAPAEGAAAAETEEEPALRSIAVLPFVTRSTAQEDEFFAEGMHDDLLTQLAKIDSLTVISRTSVMQYAGTTKTIGQIGGELGVATVLEGGVQRAGDRVRVNVQLIEAATDRHLWAETYDEELTAANVFAIQSDLAREIAGALHATLSPVVERRIDARPTEGLEAYDLYARARYGLERRAFVGEDIEGVRSLFERALAADSAFAASWVGLARTYLAAWNWRRMPREEAEARAQAALERALALDADLAEAHRTRGQLLQHQERLEDAERALRRSIELHPGDAEGHRLLRTNLEAQGDFEGALAATRRAMELDPLDIGSRHSLAPDRLFFAGRFDESVAEGLKAVEMAPDDGYAWYNIGWANAGAGRGREAVEAFHRAGGLTTNNQGPVRMGLAYAWARAGQRDSALA